MLGAPVVCCATTINFHAQSFSLCYLYYFFIPAYNLVNELNWLADLDLDLTLTTIIKFNSYLIIKKIGIAKYVNLQDEVKGLKRKAR